MSWSSRRRLLYLAGFIGAVALLIGLPGYLIFHKAPTCTDGKQNGDEEGVDCGGSCALVCSFRAAAPIVRWQRFFEVIPGVYATLAIVENPNANAAAFDVPYSFKLRAPDNLLVYEQKGRVYLPPKSVVPIFDTGLQTGERTPARVEFALSAPTWIYGNPSAPKLDVRDPKLSLDNGTPVVTATIRSAEERPVGSFAAVAILYDKDENAIQASRTIVDGIAPLGETDVVFTWPQPLGADVARIDVIPVFPPPVR